MVITKVLAHFCPPSYIFLSLSLSLPARLSFYLFLSHLVSGNRIEVRQWIVARHLPCYNPLSCFTLFCGVKHDKIKFHEFVCVCPFFSFSPVTPSLSPLSLSLSLSLSHPWLSLSLSPIPISLFPTLVSLSIFSLSHPCRFPLFLPLMSPFLSLCHPCLSFSLSLPPLSLFISFSLPPMYHFLYPSLSLSRQSLFFSHASLFLSLSPSKERGHKIIL